MWVCPGDWAGGLRGLVDRWLLDDRLVAVDCAGPGRHAERLVPGEEGGGRERH
jgi:hypothetical protein